MPYRDELEALEMRREGLERELLEVREALAAVRRRALPVLQAPRIENPCDVPWSAMKGDERVRLCTQCAKHVYNLSAMTRREAEELLAREPRLCIRYYERPDGTILTTDCPTGTRKRRARRARRAVALGLLAATASIPTALLKVTGKPAPVPYKNVDTLVAEHLVGTPVLVEGVLVHGSIAKGDEETRFQIAHGGVSLPVRYAGTILPDTFRDLPDFDLGVAAQGELGADGTFRATLVLAKAPSGAMYLRRP
jgi:cytochrome c-type biogenesis protein CcmE